MKKVLHRSVLAALMLLFNILSVYAGERVFTGEALVNLLNEGLELAENHQLVVTNGGAVLSSEKCGISYSLDSQSGALLVSAADLRDFNLDIPCRLEGITSISVYGEYVRKDAGESSFITYLDVYTLDDKGAQAEEVVHIMKNDYNEGFDSQGDEEAGIGGDAPVIQPNALHGLRFSFGRISNLKGYKISSIMISTSALNFGFAETSLNATLGQVLDMPSFTGEMEGYGPSAATYESSDENVAFVDNSYKIHALSTGTATITADVPASADRPSGRASFILTVTEQALTGSVEDITLAEPNTLRYVLADLETTAIGSLTLHGKVGSEDLALIKEQKGRLENLQALDLGDIELVADEGVYSEVQVGHNDLNVDTYNVYYLSGREDSTYSGKYNGISGTSTYKIYTMSLAGAFAGMKTLRKLVLPGNMAEIGSCIAMGDTALTDVVLPDGIDKVPYRAFSGCSKLTKINLDGVKSVGEAAFSGTQLLDIDLRQTTEIGDYAFCNTLLKEADLSSLDIVANNVFDGCERLKEVKWNTNLKAIGELAFSGTALTELKLPEGIIEMGYRAFEGTKVETIQLPSTLLKLGWDAFSDTPWLENMEKTTAEGFIYAGNILIKKKRWWAIPDNYTLTLPEGTVAIADNWTYSLDYADISKIVKMVLPSTLKYIGDRNRTAYPLSALAEVNLPEGLEVIGEYAFGGAKLVTVTVPANVRSIGDDAFSSNNSLIRATYNATGEVGAKYIFSGCQALEKVVIGGGVTEIPKDAFYNCSSLLKVEFNMPTVSYAKSYATNARVSDNSESDSKFTFAPYCFYGCSLLTSIDYPVNTDSIGGSAFSHSGLKTAKLPWHIRSVGDMAFASCNSLSEVYLPASLMYLDKDAFYYSPLTAIYAYGTEPIDVDGDKYTFQKLAKTAKLYVRPGYQEVWDAHEVWSAFDIYPMGEDKLALGIESVLSGQDRQDVFFDLSGRRVFSPKPGGIYIKNGKKLIMK